MGRHASLRQAGAGACRRRVLLAGAPPGPARNRVDQGLLLSGLDRAAHAVRRAEGRRLCQHRPLVPAGLGDRRYLTATRSASRSGVSLHAKLRRRRGGPMAFAGMNYLAIPIATIAGFAFGAAYYMSLSRRWLAAIGTTKEELAAKGKGSPMPFIVSIVALAIMAWVLAGGIGHLGPGQVTLKNGVISALLMWVASSSPPWRSQRLRAAQGLAYGYRWHPLAGRARYTGHHTGRHHRHDGRVNEA